MKIKFQHSKSAEQAVIGAMLFDSRAIGQCAEIITPSDFFFDENKEVYSAILDIWASGGVVDLITVSESLKKRGVLESCGGVSWLADMANSVPIATHVTEYAKTVRDKSIARELHSAAVDIQGAIQNEEDVASVLDSVQQKIIDISSKTVSGSMIRLSELSESMFERLDRLQKEGYGATGISTGFIDLDNILCGLQNSDYIIVAARPSMGKTSFALNLAQHMSIIEEKHIAIFSLEMSKEQLYNRLLAQEARVDLRVLQTGQVTDSMYHDLIRASSRLSHANIYVDDKPGATVLDIRAKSQRLKMQGKLDCIIIDYMQLMDIKGKNENRQQEISRISRMLKAIARDLNVPLICLSQLSRAVEARADKRPMLSDLRESGAIEQDADVVIFLYREEYYLQNSVDEDTGEDVVIPPDIKGVAEVIVAKQRNGPVGKIRLSFQAERAAFANLSYRDRTSDV